MSVFLLSGPMAAGKGYISEILKELNGESSIEHRVLSDLLRQELERRNQPINRNTLRDLGNELRAEKGSGVLGEMVVPVINGVFKDGEKTTVIIDSIRNPAEVEAIKQHYPEAVLIFIDAPFEVRLERAKKRGRGDDMAMENLKASMRQELERDPAGFDLETIKEKADILADGLLDKEQMREFLIEKLKLTIERRDGGRSSDGNLISSFGKRL